MPLTSGGSTPKSSSTSPTAGSVPSPSVNEPISGGSTGNRS
jgi:hypothetical protein